MGGGSVKGEVFGSKRRVIVKGPRPPKWSTVNGIKAMWWVFRACITASAVEAVVVLPCSLARMLAK